MTFKIIVANDSVYKFFTEYMNTFLGYISKPVSEIGGFNFTDCEEFIAVQRGDWIPDYNLHTVKHISIVNTEQLCDINVENRVIGELEQLRNRLLNHSNLTLYDYSQTNIDIFKKRGYTCHIHEYISPPEEITYLKALLNTPKEYDIGFVGAFNTRRKGILDTLSTQCKVSYIDTFGLDRDTKIAKCSFLLNIHWEEHFTIFETIRCNRWLHAGHTVISENSIDIPDVSNLECVPYDNLISYILQKIKA
jgi:hypothetical protein